MQKLTGYNLFLPFYHIVSDEYVRHISPLYPVRSVNLFENDLDYICKHFEPVDADCLYELIINNKKLKKPTFHLSFDDGLRECYDIIAPILLRKGISATFFVNSAFIDNKDIFYRYKAALLVAEILNSNKTVLPDVQQQISKLFNIKNFHSENFIKALFAVDYKNSDLIDKAAKFLDFDYEIYLQKEKPYMLSKQIEWLAAKGFTIGAHSIDHPDYRALVLKQQVEQTAKSVDYVVDNFNPKNAFFSFPFTDDGISKNFFYEIDKLNATKLTFGTAGLKRDCIQTNIQRFPMEGNLLPAKTLINTEYLYYLLKKPFGLNVINRMA